MCGPRSRRTFITISSVQNFSPPFCALCFIPLNLQPPPLSMQKDTPNDKCCLFHFSPHIIIVSSFFGCFFVPLLCSCCLTLYGSVPHPSQAFHPPPLCLFIKQQRREIQFHIPSLVSIYLLSLLLWISSVVLHTHCAVNSKVGTLPFFISYLIKGFPPILAQMTIKNEFSLFRQRLPPP